MITSRPAQPGRFRRADSWNQRDATPRGRPPHASGDPVSQPSQLSTPARTAARRLNAVPLVPLVPPVLECGICREWRECAARCGPARNQRVELPLREDLTVVFDG
jgi:hypothetical protein